VRRMSVRSVALLAAALAFPAGLQAGVKTEEKTQLQFGGFIGGIMNRFGGKAAKEGVVGTVAVVGDRKLTLNENTGQLIDLGEEKIYDLDVKHKTYKVTTFAELKKQMEEAREKAAKESREEQKPQKEDKTEQQPQKEYEVDFDVKNTGQSKAINGFDAKQTVMTVTVREKGRTLQQSGGVVLASDLWMTPKIAATKEIEDFDRRYAQKMAEIMGIDPAAMQQMAMIAAMYPGIQKAMEKMRAEKVNLDGTPVLTTFTITGVKSAAQAAQAEREDEKPSGLGGFLAKKMMKKKEDPGDPRSMLMTSNVELLKVMPEATPQDVALPADFKQKQ
jgi:hypothetical protein